MLIRYEKYNVADIRSCNRNSYFILKWYPSGTARCRSRRKRLQKGIFYVVLITPALDTAGEARKT